MSNNYVEPRRDNLLNNGMVNNNATANELFPTPVRRRRKKKIIIIIFLILIVLAVGITLPMLFLVQRSVSYDILPVNTSNSTINVTPDGFTYPVTPIVLIDNKNYFDIFLRQVSIEASHPSYDSGRNALATGIVSNVNLIKRDVTKLPFLFNIEFKRSLDLELEYLSSMLTNCSEPTNSKLYFDVEINVDYKMWAKSGTMHQEKSIIFPCPITNEEASRYKSLLSIM